MGSAIIPSDFNEGLDALTPAQRLFLYYYAQCPDEKWACEQTGCSIVTLRKKWKYQEVFAGAWAAILRGDVIDIIRSAAADQAGKSFARIIDLRDQDKNPRVALDAAKACLRAIHDPTFQSHVTVTKEMGANWLRVIRNLLPEIRRLGAGEIIDHGDWQVIEEGDAEEETSIEEESQEDSETRPGEGQETDA